MTTFCHTSESQRVLEILRCQDQPNCHPSCGARTLSHHKMVWEDGLVAGLVSERQKRSPGDGGVRQPSLSVSISQSRVAAGPQV